MPERLTIEIVGIKCLTCDGMGTFEFDNGKTIKVKKCPVCGGTGIERIKKADLDGNN